MSALFHWPARRADAEVPAAGYEAGGFLPGTFESEETLADTSPMLLSAAEAHAQALEAAAWWPEVLMGLICAGSIVACAFSAGLL